MPFLIDDDFWLQAKAFLENHADPLAAILAPNEFMEFFPGTYHYNITYVLPPDQFDFVVFHKAMVTEIERPFALRVLRQFQAVFANDVFVIYAKQPIKGLAPLDETHIEALLKQYPMEELLQKTITTDNQQCAIAITTYNRPQSLARSLPQLLALGAPVVVVDDASTPEHLQQNQEICDRYQVPLIRIPTNRGLPNAINTAVGYWLADPDIHWISYFQDDVDVHPDTLTVLQTVQDAKDRPLLTGRDAAEHPIYHEANIGGYRVLFKRSMPGVHLHAHRDYWLGVMPIPSPYLGAPKPDKGKPGQGADEDWWVTAWSPRSIVKRGGYVVCVPGLVRTFDQTGEDSTWRNLVFAQSDQDFLARAMIDEPAPVAEKAIALSATPAFPGESLEGVKVLVDGYNLQMTSGTGIKTYGTSLIQALRQLDAQVDVLLSRRGSRKNQILDEVLFFDDQTKPQNKIFELINLLKGMIRSSSGSLYQARRRTTAGQYVIKQGKFTDDFLQYAESFNLPQCYEIANSLYKYLNRETTIYVPEKIDIWHTTYPLPIQIKGAQKITTIHDLIPLRLPYTTLDDKENFYNKVRDSLKESAVTIAVSEHSKKDLLSYFDIDPDQVVVTYQPIALEPLKADEDEISEYLNRYKLKYQNYILFVGAIEPKKNVGRLLEAYATTDTDLPLVIVGKKAWSWEDELGKMQYLFANDAKRQVKFLEYVSTDSLRYLYRGAYCFVFPSLYEGFGLPTVEAMSFGCPVITSRVSCLPEVCGDGALYVDPYDISDIKAKLEKLLGDAALRETLSQNGQIQAEMFSGDNYRHRLYQAYAKALKLK